jgi:hypothetical protein
MVVTTSLDSLIFFGDGSRNLPANGGNVIQEVGTRADEKRVAVRAASGKHGQTLRLRRDAATGRSGQCNDARQPRPAAGSTGHK